MAGQALHSLENLAMFFPMIFFGLLPLRGTDGIFPRVVKVRVYAGLVRRMWDVHFDHLRLKYRDPYLLQQRLKPAGLRLSRLENSVLGAGRSLDLRAADERTFLVLPG